jgi:hypothetical protein
LEKTNTDLTVKLSSIDELKKAIRDLKEKMRQDRIAARKGSKANQEIAGNRGYIIWKGQPTLKNKVRIEVIPAS